MWVLALEWVGEAVIFLGEDGEGAEYVSRRWSGKGNMWRMRGRWTQEISLLIWTWSKRSLGSAWGGGRVELDRAERRLKGKCTQLFESRIVTVGCWGKEAGLGSVGGGRMMWGVLRGVCLFAIGQVSVVYPIWRFWYGYEGFYKHWQGIYCYFLWGGMLLVEEGRWAI